MRKPERLYAFYNKLCALHIEAVPDWRFGQLLVNFLQDCKEDPFYWEEDEFLKRFEEYLKPYMKK